jgi:hypothetical protein
MADTEPGSTVGWCHALLLTMRSVLILSVAIAGCASSAPAGTGDFAPAEVGPRYISIGADALDTARAVAAAHGETLDVIDADAEVAVVAFDAASFGDLSEQMHERFHRCGGFVVHDSLDDARASLHTHFIVVGAAVDYTLDHAETVRAVLPALDAARVLETIRELSTQPNRHFRSSTGAAASIWLAERWRSFTSRPEVTVELFDHGYAQKSVILTIPGRRSRTRSWCSAGTSIRSRSAATWVPHRAPMTMRRGSRRSPRWRACCSRRTSVPRARCS